jgi:hypothetical protein
MASQILGRRATSATDYAEAFTVERIDVISEISDETVLLSLGRNTVGPRDGLYVLDEGGSFRIYIQERGIPLFEARSLDFDRARDAVIDRILMMNGIPFSL